MASIETSITIDAPREEVFALFSDFHHLTDRISAIVRSELITDGPIGVGTRFRETRVMFGKEHTEEMEITEFVPDERYSVEAQSCGSHYLTTFQFSDEGGGTRVDMRFDATPRTLGAKIFAPIMARLMLKSCLRLFEKDMQELKAACEGKPGDDSPTPATA